jgi:hypothetical protein
MKRVTLTVVAVLLAVPAGAQGKGGVIFDRYPDVQAVGSPMHFTAMVMRGLAPGQPAKPLEGARPLVSFHDKRTGEVVRVRASRSDLNGLSYGSVRLPSKGPWETRITVAGHLAAPDDAEPFRVGVGLIQTIPAADAAKRSPARGAGSARADGGGEWWLWLASAAAIGSALLAAVIRRRGRWGAA